MRKTKISPSLKVYNRYYGKKTLIVKYRKTYEGTATVKYVNGRKIKRWNTRDRICQARRRWCPPGARVYVEGGGSSTGVVGALVAVCIICCCICFCCWWSRGRGGHDGDVVIIEDHGSYHSGGHDVDIHIDDYSHHSGGGSYHDDGSHHDDHGDDYGDDHGDDDHGDDDGGDYGGDDGGGDDGGDY